MPLLNSENTVVIACSMMKNEINRVFADHDLKYPIVWLEKGLHEYPEKLKEELAKRICEYNRMPYIILLYGMCGYAVTGLSADGSTLVIPKFDDCVRMLMCLNKGELIQTEAGHLYVTDEWVTSEKFLLKEFDGYIETYGKRKGRMSAKMMIGNYSGIDVIDDGTYDAPACAESIREKAESYGLTCQCVRGTLRVIEKILLGEWDEEVVVKAPGETVSMDDFDDRTRCI